MSHLLNVLDGLAARARMENAPAVDVSSRVLSRLSREARPPVWSLMLFASSTLVCAVAVLASSLPLIEMVSDPWSAMFLAAAEVLR